MNVILEIVGWVGSALIVISLMQARVLRFRWLNLIGSVIATAYNAVIGIWPFVAMNAVIALISAYWLRRLYREAHDPSVYQVVPVAPDDPYLRHLLAVHSADVAAHAPDFTQLPAAGVTRHTFLIVRGDEAVGVVAVAEVGDGVADVELDWVKPRFRDFTPGQFVYRESGALPAAGIRRVQLIPHENTDREYLRKAGFKVERTHWVRDLEPTSATD